MKSIPTVVRQILTSSLEEMSELSQLDKSRWSRYFNGQSLSERTLVEVSQRLEIPPEIFLAALRLRREGYRDIPEGHWLKMIEEYCMLIHVKEKFGQTAA
jgi:transcriptional regulator with XRE-family HTH domain